LLALLACCKDDQQELIILLYVHLCSSSGRCCLTVLSRNDNQEALGIEARKNEIKKASMGVKEKRIKSSARFGILVGEKCASTMPGVVASRELYTSVALMLDVCFLREPARDERGVFCEDAHPVCKA
jgi:hypothetical protein